jgi:hypothetical protein
MRSIYQSKLSADRQITGMVIYLLDKRSASIMGYENDPFGFFFILKQ